MTVNVIETLEQFIKDLLTNRDTAFQFASDPNGTLAAQGLTDADLSGVDVPGAVGQACNDPGVSGYARGALQGYTSGSGSMGSAPVSPPPPSQHQSVEQVIQHLNYVTYVAYEGDEIITNEIVNNNTDINVGDDFSGDIDVDNVTAGDGGVAVNGDNEGAINTGDESAVVNADEGSSVGNVNSGDGAFQANDSIIDGPVNTGVNTGIIADGDVNNAVVGDHNQSVQNAGGFLEDNAIGFGSGDVTQVTDSTLTDSAVAGGDATNVSNNDVSEGSGLAVGGDASGEFHDSSTTTTLNDFDTNTTTVTDSDFVDTDQAGDDLNEDAHEVLPA